MSTYRTSDSQRVKVYEIATNMKKSGLSDSFIDQAVKLAIFYEGAYDLFELWNQEKDKAEKDQIIADLQEEIDEFQEQPKSPVKKPYISFQDLELISKNVTGFKAHLKSMVDQWGGISKLAKETNIPQPSLSRFFSSSSMPRRTTIYKIANALKLSEKEIITDWAA
jgi:DNA-binding phage protein